MRWEIPCISRQEDKNNVNESLTFANLCASKIIQVYGAKFDDKSEYQTLINRFNN